MLYNIEYIPIPMNTHQASKIVLNLYPKNVIRIGRIKTRLKLKGIPLTQWINSAIAEKLDREHPETNVPDSEYVPALVELSAAERHALERLKAEQAATLAALAAFERSPVPDEPPPPDVLPADNGEDAGFWGEEDLDMDKATAMLRRIRQR